jgi:hypothetical protein
MTSELAHYAAGYHDRGLEPPMNSTEPRPSAGSCLANPRTYPMSADEEWVRRWADAHGGVVSHYAGYSTEPYLSVAVISKPTEGQSFYFSTAAFGEDRLTAAFRDLRKLLGGSA